MTSRVWDGLKLARPSNRLDEFGKHPSVAAVCVLEMPLYDAGSVVVDILNSLVREVDKRDVVKIPLSVVEASQIASMIQNGCRREIGIRKGIRTKESSSESQVCSTSHDAQDGGDTHGSYSTLQ